MIKKSKHVVKKTNKVQKAQIKGVSQEIRIQKETGKPAKVILKRQIFGKAPEEKVFHLKDGRKLSSLLELTEAFESMAEDTFRHHVNDAKNDFSSWTKDVFKDEELAKDIQDIKDKGDAEIRLLKHFVKKLSSAT